MPHLPDSHTSPLPGSDLDQTVPTPKFSGRSAFDSYASSMETGQSSRSRRILGRVQRAVVPVSLSVIALLLVTASVGVFMHPESRKLITSWAGAPAEGAYGPSVKPASADSGPLLARFTVAGDVGTGDDEEYETAAAMTRLLRDGPIDGLVLLGDNVYPDGDPELLDETVFIPFGSLLYSGTDLLPVLGNHDIRDGNGPGQIEALGMPGQWYSQQYGDLLFIGLDSNNPADPWQLQWLDETLNESDSKWKVVAMHHPPYSAGLHGNHESSVEHFVPLFEKYDVDLVLSGHDHDYQRSKPQNGVTYVVSGGGATIRPTSSNELTAVSWSVHHFVELQVYENHILGQAHAQDGRVFDTFEVTQNG